VKIYVASSWRNEKQPEVVKALREAGHDVYDFRAPPGKNTGFHWSEIDPDWKSWSPEEFREQVRLHPLATAGFEGDFEAMQNADACVLVLPSGRSAHLEAGWFTGQDRLTIVLLHDGEPELMYKLTDHLCLDIEEVVKVCNGYAEAYKGRDEDKRR